MDESVLSRLFHWFRFRFFDLQAESRVASPFQIGCAVAAGLGCGAAFLYGNRLFAVEVVQRAVNDGRRIRSPCAFRATTPTVLASTPLWVL